MIGLITTDSNSNVLLAFLTFFDKSCWPKQTSRNTANLGLNTQIETLHIVTTQHIRVANA